MWLLIMTLAFVQQESGTEVKTKTFYVRGITEKKDCEDGGKSFVNAHEKVAVEPRSEDSTQKNDKGDFDLLRPTYFCVKGQDFGFAGKE